MNPHLLLRNVNVGDGSPGRRVRLVVEAFALHGVGHAHGDHLALVPAGVARRLGVEPLLDAASEVPYAIDWKDNELS